LPGVPPLHLAIHDRLGNHLVIEFIKGEMKVYDNPNTVLTNYPPLDWHLINLQNYIGLTALNSQAVQLKGMDLTGPGQGTGLFGIPGDWTPPSRFVRMTTLLHFAKQANNQMEGVNLAEHLLNAVDIPKGEIIARDGEEDYTQWIVIKDLTNKLFYFRTYDNLCLKMIDLKKLNFNPNAPQKTMGMSFKQGYLDVTSDL
jgi:choloylglycine hydrolase